MTQNAESARKRAPGTLWHLAADEHPKDLDARRERFLELMREEGHIVPATHPEAGPRTLPCGWPGGPV